MAYGRRYARMYGDPGLSLKGIVRGLGKVVKTGLSVAGGAIGSLPGIGGVYKEVSKALPYGSFPWEKKASALGTVTGGRLQGPMPGFGPTIIPSPAGQVMIDRTRAQFGGAGHRRKRMNPLNPRAARRAIARIKSLRKLTHSIESQLPHQRTTARKKPCR